jgi:hypothetical protein
MLIQIEYLNKKNHKYVIAGFRSITTVTYVSFLRYVTRSKPLNILGASPVSHVEYDKKKENISFFLYSGEVGCDDLKCNVRGECSGASTLDSWTAYSNCGCQVTIFVK